MIKLFLLIILVLAKLFSFFNNQSMSAVCRPYGYLSSYLSNSLVIDLINAVLSFFTSFNIAFLSAGMGKYFSAHKFISIIIGSKSIPFLVNLYNTFALLSG